MFGFEQVRLVEVVGDRVLAQDVFGGDGVGLADVEDLMVEGVEEKGAVGVP